MPRRSLLVGAIGTIAGVLIGAATVTTAAPPTPSPTEVVAQVEISGLAGEGAQEDFPGAIEARSFDFLASNSGNGPAFRKLEVLASIDRSSPGLLRRLALETSIPEVKISLIRSGGEPFVFKVLTLSRAKVSSFREYVSGRTGDLPTVEISFVYKKLDVVYTQQNLDGTPGSSTGFCWQLDRDTTC